MKRIFIFVLILFLQENLSARLPGLIPYRKGKLWGYCDSTKKMIIEPQYEKAYPFDKGFGIIEVDSSSEVIDMHGNVQLRIHDGKYQSSLETTMREKEFIFSGANGGYGVIDFGMDTIVKPVYSIIHTISTDYYACYTVKLNIVNRRGKVVFKSHYGYEYLWPEFIPSSGVFIFYGKKSCGVIDTNGVNKIPFRYDEIFYDSCAGFTGYDHKRWWDEDYYDVKFNRIDSAKSPCQNNFIRFEAMQETVMKDGKDVGKYGWYDNETKQFVHEPVYEYARRFYFGFAAFKKNGKFGFVDENFIEVIPARYDNVQDFEENSLARVSKLIHQGKWGYNQYQTLGYIDIHGTEYWEN